MSKTVSAGSINELRSIGRLVHLTHLTLVSCTGVTDGLRSGGDWIAGVRGLQYLTCDRCDLSDDSLSLFAYFPALVTLDLLECPISQAGVATVAGCSFPHLATVKLCERHMLTERTLAEQYIDELLALAHILAATHALPVSTAMEAEDGTQSDNHATVVELASDVRWPVLRTLNTGFSVLVVSHSEEYDSYVDAVHAFRRARPQILLRTGLNGG